MDIIDIALGAKLSGAAGTADKWLEENISQETGYALDRSLLLENAAAPADLVGDIKKVADKKADINLNIIGAAPGKYVKVRTVDGQGKPTSWEIGDGGSGGGSDSLLNDVTADILNNLSININPYPFKDTTGTINGITWTDNGDGTITANGIATEDSHFIVHGYTIEDGSVPVDKNKKYVINGCPSGGSPETFCIEAKGYAEGDTPDPETGNVYYDYSQGTIVTDTKYISLNCTIFAGTEVSNVTFKPQLRYVTVEIAKNVDNLLTDVNKLEKNTDIQQSQSNYNMLIYPYRETTGEKNGITWTDNGDGSITANGTATANSTFIICGWSLRAEKAICRLEEDKEYVISGCPEGGSTKTYFLAARLYDKDTSPESTTGAIKRDIGEGFSFSGYVHASVYIGIIKGTTVEDLTFWPILRQSNLPDVGYKKFNDKLIVSSVLDSMAISPSLYGAIGDGVADDTEAIQRCIDENPCKTIVFNKGTYKITNTIELYGASGGQYLLCGGATFVWDGEVSKTAVMFKIEKDYSPTISSFCRIVGGNFDGKNKCGIIFLAHAFYTEICSAKLLNFTNYGILNGTLDFDSDKSTQAKFHDCHIFQRTGQFSLEDTCAIGISCPDNQISNIVTNRTGCAYRLWCGGNSFSNCHSTIEYPADHVVIESEYNNAHIELVPKNSGTTQENVFSNMYFNVGKYVINVPVRATALISTFINCHYTYYTSTRLQFRSAGYLCAGYPTTLNVDGFDVVVGGNLDFYDYCPISSVNEKTVPRILNIHQSDRHPEASIFVANNHQSIVSKPCAIANETNPFPEAEKYYEIGAILISYTPASEITAGHYGAVKVEYSYLDEYNEAIVSFDDDGVPFIKYENNMITANPNRFFIGKTRETVTLNGITYYYYPVYVLTGENLSHRTTFKMYALDFYIKCYVRSHIVSSILPVEEPTNLLELGTGQGLVLSSITIGNHTIDSLFVEKLARLIEN